MSYTPGKAGAYELSVMTRGQHICGSPFELAVRAGLVCARECQVEADWAHCFVRPPAR